MPLALTVLLLFSRVIRFCFVVVSFLELRIVSIIVGSVKVVANMVVAAVVNKQRKFVIINSLSG